MEQILIRNLPPGTKAALRFRADQHATSVEAEARAILTEALQRNATSLVDLISVVEGIDIDFEPDRLDLRGRPAEW